MQVYPNPKILYIPANHCVVPCDIQGQVSGQIVRSVLRQYSAVFGSGGREQVPEPEKIIHYFVEAKMASRYTHAVVSRIPASIAKTVSENANEGEMNITKAREEHEQLVATLRKLGVDVIELPQDENLPRSCFVEDTAVVINGTALLTKPGDQDRRKEVNHTVLTFLM